MDSCVNVLTCAMHQFTKASADVCAEGRANQRMAGRMNLLRQQNGRRDKTVDMSHGVIYQPGPTWQSLLRMMPTQSASRFRPEPTPTGYTWPRMY